MPLNSSKTKEMFDDIFPNIYWLLTLRILCLLNDCLLTDCQSKKLILISFLKQAKVC